MACGEPRLRMTKVCAFVLLASAHTGSNDITNGNNAHNKINQQSNEKTIQTIAKRNLMHANLRAPVLLPIGINGAIIFGR